VDAQVVLRIQEDRKREAAFESRIDSMKVKTQDNEIAINEPLNHATELPNRESPVNTSLIIEKEVYIFIYI
jgi:aspartate carbamoyltransferase catalytic subunit